MRNTFTVVVIGGLLVLTGALGVRGLLILWHQHEAESFPQIQGEVLASEVTTYTGSKGRIYYRPHIIYQYDVDGVSHRGYRYRYDGHPNDSAAVHAIVAAHPQGSTLAVYCNPQNPDDAVLSVGVDLRDELMLFFLFPFWLVILWVLVKAVRDMGWGRPELAGGMKVINDMRETRVRLPRYEPLPVALLATAILLPVGALVFFFGLPLMPLWVAGEWNLAVGLLGGAAAYAWKFQGIHAGRQDLVIDEGGRSFLLPLAYKRRQRTPVSFSEIRAVVLDKVRHQTKGGVFYTYLVTLELKDDSRQKLIDLNEKRAESLAAWLRERFGLRAEDGMI